MIATTAPETPLFNTALKRLAGSVNKSIKYTYIHSWKLNSITIETICNGSVVYCNIY